MLAASQTLSKALDVSTATGWVSSDSLKTVTIQSDAIFRKFAVDWEDLKPCLKSEERSLLWRLLWSLYKFFKYFTNHRKKTHMTKVFHYRPLPNIFKFRFLQTHIEDLSYYVRKFSYYVKKFRLKAFQNHHWSTIRTRYLRQVMVGYKLLNHFENYRSMMLFQNSSRRERPFKDK